MQKHESGLLAPPPSGHQELPLAILAESLSQIVSASEDEFLSLGMNLQQVQLQSTTQRKKIAASMALFGEGAEGGILPRLSAYVRHSQQKTLEAQQAADTLCTDLAHIAQLMETIARKTHALERSGMLLNVIGINTGIECARHNAMEAMFKVVSHDTISLAEQIRTSTQQLVEQTLVARNEQDQTLASARRDIELLKSLAEESHLTTEAAMQKVAELLDYTISVINEAERMAKKIGAEISKVVMGIQFHDNLRQRVEHVNETLLELTATSPATDEKRYDAYLTLELQLAQLEKLGEELDGLYRTQTQALANIAEEIEYLGQRLGEMSIEPVAGEDAQNPVTVLLNGIGALERLNDDSLELGRKIGISAGRTEQIVRDMQTAIKSTFAIAGSVKINALNAIIKAAKFGHNGEALQVLAQGMVTVSSDARRQVELFNELLVDLGKLVHGDEASREETAPGATDVEFDAGQLETVFLHFRSELRNLCAECRELGRNLSGEVKHLDFIRQLREGIGAHADHLSSYLAQIKPDDDELLSQARANFGHRLASRYTMNEERHIHQQTLNQPRENAAAAEKEIAAGECLFFAADVGEVSAEIELFDAAGSAAAEGGNGALPSDDIVLFDETDAVPNLAGEERSDKLQPSAPEPGIELWAEPVGETTAEDFPTEAMFAESGATVSSAPAEPEGETSDEVDFGENVELF